MVELPHVETGLERGALTGVHDDAYLRILSEAAPGRFELRHHARVHRVAGVGPVEDQPADVTAPFDDERFVHGQLRGVSRHDDAWYGSGSRGSPSTRSPTTFLLISDVPPSMVLARLRNMPRTSDGISFCSHFFRSLALPPETPSASGASFRSHACAWVPSIAVVSNCTRWLRPPACTLPIELSGPGERPTFSWARTRW